MMIMMTKPYDYADDTDDENDHKNDSYTAAGAGAAPLLLRVLLLSLPLLFRDVGPCLSTNKHPRRDSELRIT